MLTRIQPYIVESQEGDIYEIDKILRELDRHGFGVEQVPTTQLRRDLLKRKAQISYPRVSLGFLGETQVKEYEGREISVPKFGVYNIDNPNLRILINRTQRGYKHSFLFGLPVPIKFEVEFEPADLPKIFQEGLVKAVDPFAKEEKVNYSQTCWGRDNPYYWGGSFDESLIDSYRGLRAISLNSSFHGIIPEKSRKRIQLSQGMFKNNIYLIAERTPEDWTINEHRTRITADPLAVGVLDNEIYIVDHFDTSPLERYVMKEWRSD